MTIEQYKEQLASFNTADFGEYSPEIFIDGNKYIKPTVYPKKGAHPRIHFTKKTVETVRKNLSAEENAPAYKRYIELSETEWDGKYTIEEYKATEEDYYYFEDHAAIMEAKAFRYAMTGDKKYGYEAILEAKNALLTIFVPHTVSDWCRRYGFVMYTVACVYDWCYDLMTEEDKRQIIAGCVNLLGVHFEVVCRVSDTNKLPTGQGTVYGHGAEAQVLEDYFSFAIAVADEAPEIYELVGGRVLNDYVEAQNYMYQSRFCWEGTLYGACRYIATIIANLLVYKMTDGKMSPFNGKGEYNKELNGVEEAAVSTTYIIRPDGQPYRIGDSNENTASYNYTWMAISAFYAGNLYKNSYLKAFAYKHLKEFTVFWNMTGGLSAVQFLVSNDPEVPHIYEEALPLTRTTSHPFTGLFAKSAHNVKDAFGIYIGMPEIYASSHTHMECGSFQIYYKGALATDSGSYASWGDSHHHGYASQTVSSNSLLIYNPSRKDYIHPNRPNMYYSGGQSVDNGAVSPQILDEILNHPSLGQSASLGKANGEKNGKYLYSYLGGDMTKAYDAVTVDEVARYIVAVATDDTECPYAAIVFDRITSKEASYHKAALIHVQEEPTVTDDGFAIITNTKMNYSIGQRNSGKLIVQSVGYETQYDVIGGEGKEYWIAGVDESGNYSLKAGKNLPSAKHTVPENSIAEYGWGRIEISPKESERTNRMLTVMYVTDADNASAPVKAEKIESETLSGAVIFGKAVIFPTSEKLLSKEASFTLTEADECFIAGVAEGKWTVSNGAYIQNIQVKKGENLLCFKTDASGTYTIKL